MKTIIILSISFITSFIMQSAEGSAVGMEPTFYPKLNEQFQLRFHETASITNGPQLTLLNIDDSRCPSDVTCVWEGEVKILLNVVKDWQDLGNFTLTSRAGNKDLATQTVDKYYIQVMQVDPYPVSTRNISSSDYVVTLIVSDTKNILPPLKQFKSGIKLDKIKCKSSYELVMKKTNGNPACISSETMPKLIERGWAVHVLPEYSTDTPTNSGMFENKTLEITTKEINYFENATGYLARPSYDATYPGVILIHEWWGLNENIKEMARTLASQGYIVLAADLYASQAATTPDGARQLLTTFNVQKGMENISAAVNFLQNNGAQKIATIGWCFGGTQAMNYAVSAENRLDATVIYYGQPVTNTTKLIPIIWPVLGIFGELDSGIPVEKVREFESALNNLGIENEIYVYPGVGHAFANPSGERYAPEEAKDAWQKTVSFLDKHLKQS